ncbi:MAG: hypothetical protein FWH11_00710 [Micrococcales bacterium]|nr:hypothetical protein [Micrococcales bacterium]
MDRLAALDRIATLLVQADEPSVVTSVRVPAPLKEALRLAVEHLGLDVSTSWLATDAIRLTLEAAVLDAGLADIYARSPGSRPSLVDVALALAEQDGSPIADRCDLLDVAARQLLERHPDADARDLLLWVEAQQVAA